MTETVLSTAAVQAKLPACLFENPTRLVSFEEVRQIFGNVMWDVSRALEKIGRFKEFDPGIPAQLDEWDDDFSMAEWMRGLKRSSESLSLPLSVISIDRLIARLEQSNQITCGELASLAEEISSRISDELGTRLIFQVDSRYSAYYRQAHLFGEEVDNAFKSAIPDIEEAGTCLACHRGTAVVFHLMRVVEVALRAIAKSLNNEKIEPSRNPSWDSILKKCDEELAKPIKDRADEWRSRNVFFAEATANLRAIKDAWRNPTMHVERVYTPDEAEDVFRAVKAFMRHLATGIREDRIRTA